MIFVIVGQPNSRQRSLAAVAPNSMEYRRAFRFSLSHSIRMIQPYEKNNHNRNNSNTLASNVRHGDLNAAEAFDKPGGNATPTWLNANSLLPLVMIALPC